MREIAATIGAIPWELLCRIGSRIERVVCRQPRRTSDEIRCGDLKAPKTVYACQDCGAQSPKWLGRCPDCGAWNTLVEERAPAPAAAGAPRPATPRRRSAPAARPPRSATPTSAWPPSIASRPASSELDRVLGGGVVPGIAGAARRRAGHRQVDAAAAGGGALRPRRRAGALRLGRGSEPQIKARGERLGVGDDPLYLFAETCLERVLDEACGCKPALLVVDSIQTVFSTKLQSAPGSVAQVREAATQLLFAAKGQHLPTFIIGHVTKDGALAGPKVLEHVVDTVLYFEGERHHAHRVVRAVKNRFGAASRGRRVRDDRRRPEAGAEPVGAVPRRAARPRRRIGGAVRRRRLAAAAGRGAGARQHQHLRLRQAHRQRPRRQPRRRCCWPCSRSAPAW